MGLKDIYIIDHRVVGPEGQSAADTILDQLPSSDDIVGVAALPSMSIAGLIQSILVDSLGVSGDHPPRDVRSIRIMAHGQVGALQLGTGLNGSSARDLSPLSEVLISPSPRSNPPPSPGTVLGWNQIAPSDHGFCHIFGCNLATAVPPTEPGIMHIERGSLCAPGYLGEDAIRFGTGFRLLTQIASALGVPVTAGLDTQFYQLQSQRAHLNWHFQGPAITVYPGGLNYIIFSASTDGTCRVLNPRDCDPHATERESVGPPRTGGRISAYMHATGRSHWYDAMI